MSTLAPVGLRSGGSADLPLMAALMNDAFDPVYGEAWTPGQCLGVLSLPGVWLTLAERRNDVAGFALSRRVADEAELLLLATAQRHRRRGVGGALLRGVLAEARQYGVRSLHLEVRSGNPAVQLYRQAGFAKVGERRNYYRGNTGQVFDAHSYSIDLSV